jgi:hypothetical protein
VVRVRVTNPLHPELRAEAVGIVDTGATKTVIRGDVLRKLNLGKAIDFSSIRGAANRNQAPCAVRYVGLFLYAHVEGTLHRKLVGCNRRELHASMSQQVLVGMDVLRDGVLTVDGAAHRWQFRIPRPPFDHRDPLERRSPHG